jgi:hypothetical protein
VAEPAWEPIVDEYERWWKPFHQRFRFTPRYLPAGPPGILEPSKSVTFSLEPIFRGASAGRFSAGVDALNAEVLRAFVEVFAEDEWLVVLDWQHQSYRFNPHGHAANDDSWRVTPFPDGDYYIFVTQDLESGTFGHPWERSICVFGPSLVDVLDPTLASWLPVLRRGGRPVQS